MIICGMENKTEKTNTPEYKVPPHFPWSEQQLFFFSDQSNDISKTTTFSKVFQIFVHIASLRRESKEFKINYLILASETEKKDV